jgi:hypothetical protein
LTGAFEKKADSILLFIGLRFLNQPIWSERGSSAQSGDGVSERDRKQYGSRKPNQTETKFFFIDGPLGRYSRPQ